MERLGVVFFPEEGLGVGVCWEGGWWRGVWVLGLEEGEAGDYAVLLGVLGGRGMGMVLGKGLTGAISPVRPMRCMPGSTAKARED